MSAVILEIHPASKALADRARAVAGSGSSVLVLDTADGADWDELVEGTSRTLLARLGELLAAAGTTPITLVLGVAGPSATPTQLAAAEAAHGIIGVAAIEAAPRGRRVNTVVADGTTTDRDLAASLAYLADEEAAGFTSGATLELTRVTTPQQPDSELPVLVTGAAGGLGSAVAEAFVAAGRTVVLSDLAGPALEAQAERLGQVSVACDVTDPEDVAALATHPAVTGGLSSLQVIHGVGGSGSLEELEEGPRERSLRINGTGVWNVVSSLMPLVEAGRGSVVVLSSQAGLISEPGNGAYCAAKFAAAGLVRALATRSSDVRVHLLCPGPIDTPLMRSAFTGMAAAEGISYDDYHAGRMAVIPLGRFGSPEHMGSAALLLDGLDATGVTLAPTGAFLLT
jgi:NAD(P)-dependent dehydrogenase (short-subunit alcohol dehydrogenase family)